MDIGSILYFGAVTVWSGFLAYMILEKLLPKPEAAVAAPEPVQAFPTHVPKAEDGPIPAPMVPDYRMTEGFKAFQTGSELTVEDIVKGLSRRS